MGFRAKRLWRAGLQGMGLMKHRTLTALGGGGKHCTACESAVSGFYFCSYRNAKCPSCYSMPRERFVAWALDGKREALMPSGGRVLHVAPGEDGLVRRFRASATDYVAGDIDPSAYPRVRDCVPLDLTAMTFDAPFDVVYASHVLEHIPDDATAIREVYRNLTDDGRALFMVPLRGSTTEDGPADATPEYRSKRFGRFDHVRQYGSDITDRFEEAGFAVEVIDATDAGRDQVERFGFETHNHLGEPETDRLFVCTKKPAQAAAT